MIVFARVAGLTTEGRESPFSIRVAGLTPEGRESPIFARVAELTPEGRESPVFARVAGLTPEGRESPVFARVAGHSPGRESSVFACFIVSDGSRTLQKVSTICHNTVTNSSASLQEASVILLALKRTSW